MIRVDPGTSCMLLMGPGPPGSVIYFFVLLTGLVFNPHTAYSDVGDTLSVQALIFESLNNYLL
jgi:hypothetical protein